MVQELVSFVVFPFMTVYRRTVVSADTVALVFPFIYDIINARLVIWGRKARKYYRWAGRYHDMSAIALLVNRIFFVTLVRRLEVHLVYTGILNIYYCCDYLFEQRRLRMDGYLVKILILPKLSSQIRNNKSLRFQRSRIYTHSKHTCCCNVFARRQMNKSRLSSQNISHCSQTSGHSYIMEHFTAFIPNDASF